jgi:hypothetical protein
MPGVVAHENLPQRFDRYRATNEWNVAINRRQAHFGRRSLHLELPECAKPAEGSAIPDRMGGRITRHGGHARRAVRSRTRPAD